MGSRPSPPSIPGAPGIRAVLMELIPDTPEVTARILLGGEGGRFRAEVEVTCDVEPGGNMPHSLTELVRMADAFEGRDLDRFTWVPGYADVEGMEASHLALERVDGGRSPRLRLVLLDRGADHESRADFDFRVPASEVARFARSLRAAARRGEEGFETDLSPAG